MRWYEGSIAQAVSASKSKGAVFVVYTEGSDDTSKKLTRLINSSDVSRRLDSDYFVAIKIEANTLPHQQFSEIYKQVTVPSVFFIGKNGMPLEIVKDADNTEELIAKVDGVLQKSGIVVPPKQTSEQSSSSAEKSPVSTAEKSSPVSPGENSSSKEQKSPGSPPNVVCENDVCTIQKSPATSPDASKADTSQTASKPEDEQKPKESVKSEGDRKPDSPSKELLAEERVRRAQELIELQRQQKLKEEEEKEKQKEVERRKTGQGVQQLKKWQEDQELKQMVEERERERREDKQARDRVLAQIAQDKAERAVRFSTSPPSETQQQKASGSPPAARRPIDNTVAKLQFKLPDGSTHTHQFGADDTLHSVRQYVSSTLSMPSGDFTLATAFPRREFTQADGERTLADLQLVPNALLLVLRSSNGTITTASGGGGLTSLIWTLFTPIFSIFNYLKSFVFGSSPASAPSTSQEAVKRHAQDNEAHSNSYQMKRLRESTVIRRQGNIARLSDRTDSDDENNTWNGNSTQQM